jgi:hypothetical protein
MLRALFLFAVLFLVGCGGGSSPTTSGTPLAPSEQLQQAMEDCVAPDLADLSALLERFEALAVQGDAALLDALYDITGIDMVTGQVGLRLDLDVDGAPDVQLTIGFKNAAGQWFMPLDLSSLLGGTPTIDDILASIPDGASLVVESTLLGESTGGGTFAVFFAGGLPSRVTGEGSFARNGCGFDYSLDFTPPADFESGQWPLLDLDVAFDAGDQTARGTVTLDGTNVAVATAQLPGEPEETWTIDLLTGVVTPS